MLDLAERWNRAPRAFRGSAMAALGALGAVTVSVAMPHTATEAHNPNQDRANFWVGVGCAKKPSRIIQTHTGNAFKIRCEDLNGSVTAVRALGELTVDHATPPYDAAIPITSPDTSDDWSVVRFSFTGDEGLAVIGTEQQVGPNANSNKLNAIWR